MALQEINASASRIDTRPITRNVHLETSLADIRVPVSGIWGAKDATVGGNFTRHERLLRSFDLGAELVVIPDAGHWVQYESSGLFNDTLLRLLNAQRRWGER